MNVLSPPWTIRCEVRINMYLFIWYLKLYDDHHAHHHGALSNSMLLVHIRHVEDFVVSAWYSYRFCSNMSCLLSLTVGLNCHSTVIAISVALYCLFAILRWKKGTERTWNGFNMRWEWEVLSKYLTKFRSPVSALRLPVSTYIKCLGIDVLIFHKHWCEANRMVFPSVFFL